MTYIFLGMLTQGPAPDPKRKLNISTFLKHLSDFLICTRNSVSIVLLLGMLGGLDRWVVVDSYQGVGGGDSGWVLSHSFFICVFVFCSLISCLFFKWVEHDSCCVCFFCLLFAFCVSGPSNWELLGYRNCSVCNATLFIKSVSDHYSVDFLGKGRVF